MIAQNRNDLDAGIYSVTIIDQNGCSVTAQDLNIVNTCGCDADAGTLTAGASSVCIDLGQATISATANGDSNVPAGYQNSIRINYW